MIKLSVQQVIDLSGISIESLRHWRRVLPPLHGRNGYIASFSPGDVLFLLAVRSLVKDLGIPVSALADASQALHAYLSQLDLPIRPGETFAISLAADEVVSGRCLDSLQPPFIVLSLHQLVAQFQAAWTGDSAQQMRLALDTKGSSFGRGIH